MFDDKNVITFKDFADNEDFIKNEFSNKEIKIKATSSPDEHTDLPYIEMEDDDWGKLAETMREKAIDKAVVSIGPVHPSTHGVLRIVCEIEGETITDCRVGTGYLHTGIEKNMEYRTWTQGVTYCTRMDYVAPLFQEVAYCMGVEKLLGVKVSGRVDTIRVLLMELNRIASHLVAIGTGGNELGATTMLTISFRARENILRILEHITGLRMNHAYIRPGGLATDLPEDTIEFIHKLLPKIRDDIGKMQDLTMENPIFKLRQKDIGYISLPAAMALGLTGPCLRATGLPMDMRKLQPYCGYETYDFKIPVRDKSDSYNRTAVRFEECYESLRIVVQALERLENDDSPIMVEDKKIGWPSDLTIGKDGQGNNPKYVDNILGTSMEALIHHFKMISHGFDVPKGQVYTTVEHAKGVMGVHLVSDGGNKPYRAHFRDPSFSNLQSTSIMVEGGQIADFVVTLASIDPVLGGVDR